MSLRLDPTLYCIRAMGHRRISVCFLGRLCLLKAFKNQRVQARPKALLRYCIVFDASTPTGALRLASRVAHRNNRSRSHRVRHAQKESFSPCSIASHCRHQQRSSSAHQQIFYRSRIQQTQHPMLSLHQDSIQPHQAPRDSLRQPSR